MSNLSSNLPHLGVPFLNADGSVNQTWLMFLVQVYQRTGGPDTPPLSLTQIQSQGLYNLTVQTQNGFSGTVTYGENATMTLDTTVAGIIYGSGGSLKPVTIGTNLTFTGGTLNATGGGSSPSSLAFSARHG